MLENPRSVDIDCNMRLGVNVEFNNNNPSRQLMKFWHSRHNSQIKLTSQELLDISQDISHDYAPAAVSTIHELVLLPVDPYHLYAYWNLDENKVHETQKGAVGNNLALRVFWLPDEKSDMSKTKLWFDVDIHKSQNQIKVRLPIDETAYSAVIGNRFLDHSYVAFAQSNVIHVPRGRMVPEQGKEDSSLTKIKPQITKPNPAQQHDTPSSECYDEALTGSTIKQTLYKKGIDVRLNPDNQHSSLPQADDVSTSHYDEKSIDANIKRILYEKGIDLSLDPERESSDKSHYQIKSASGQFNKQ